jgi:microcystin-dependent protein
MAAVAQYRDDISGAIVTGGSVNSYTITSYSSYTSLPFLDKQMLAFTPHATNTGAVTINVDSLGARGLRGAPGVDLPSGTLIAGTPYVATFNNGDAVWYLQGGVSNPYNIPLGAGLDYWLPTTPNSAFAFPTGQAISRSTYATLFAAMGTTFGAGDGSTTFNLPDKRGRVSAAVDNMGGASAGRFTPAFGTGAGSETIALSQANLPAVALSVSGTTSTWQPTINGGGLAAVATGVSAGTTGVVGGGAVSVFQSTTFAIMDAMPARTVSGNTANLGSGTAFSNTQPTITCNYILRII